MEIQSDVGNGGTEFADMTDEEFRNARLMKGEQNCSATGNHVMTSADLPKKVRGMRIGFCLLHTMNSKNDYCLFWF